MQRNASSEEARRLLDKETSKARKGNTCLDTIHCTERGRWLFVALLFGVGIAAAVVGVLYQHKASAASNSPMAHAQAACAVYCHGELLEAVQSRALFNDSKTFVDMPMSQDPVDVLAAFHKLGPDFTDDALLDFVDNFFSDPDTLLQEWTPPDFVPEPEVLRRLPNETLRQWALSVNSIWPTLGRRAVHWVQNHPTRSSLLPPKNPFIIPGGRFRETYYWDTYWIVKGLLVCGMNETAYGMIENLLQFVHDYGFVPNGARAYYLTRSQPPLLSEMVRVFFEYSHNTTFLKAAYPLLEKEYAFWMNTDVETGHAVDIATTSVGNVRLNRYCANTTLPRPESYKEDTDLVNTAHRTGKARDEMFQNIASGAETGWDFSSRWFSSRTDMTTIQTRRVIPVDLNVIMYRFETNMAFFSTLVSPKSLKKYIAAARDRFFAMSNLMYNSDTHLWHDLIADDGTQADEITAAAFVPLWAGFPLNHTQKADMVRALNASELYRAGGVMTSSVNSTQQWDMPNAWAPLQALIMDGLAAMNTTQATDLKTQLQCRWLNNMYLAFNQTGFMYEKYNALEPGVGGGGGEYIPQTGFGWTNGVFFSILADIGQNYDALCNSSQQ